MEFKEITAKTVDEAITKACLEFETSSDNLEIQVVQEGTSGFLGFIGSKPAVIKVRKKVQEEEFDILKELAKEEKKEKKAVNGTWIKYLSTGAVFAISCFTDPTYYAVILLGGETGSFLTASLLLTIWFVVSQLMALIVYIANSLNHLNKLAVFVDKLKEKKIKPITYALYTVFVIIAIVLLVDTGFYLFDGRYRF